MSNVSTIQLTDENQKLLRRASYRFGFSVNDIINKIVSRLADELLSVPEEDVSGYRHADKIEEAYQKAIRASDQDLVNRLPKSIIVLKQ